jgi:hypothetical protein
MGSMSDYLEQKVLDHVLGKTTFTGPTTLYLSLFTVAPSDAGGGTEVTGGSYDRCDITNNTTNFPNATGTSPTTKASGVSFAFAAATADWGTIVAWGLHDANTAGNLLWWGSVTPNKTVLNGDTASFASGALTITQD